MKAFHKPSPLEAPTELRMRFMVLEVNRSWRMVTEADCWADRPTHSQITSIEPTIVRNPHMHAWPPFPQSSPISCHLLLSSPPPPSLPLSEQCSPPLAVWVPAWRPGWSSRPPQTPAGRPWLEPATENWSTGHHGGQHRSMVNRIGQHGWHQDCVVTPVTRQENKKADSQHKDEEKAAQRCFSTCFND